MYSMYIWNHFTCIFLCVRVRACLPGILPSSGIGFQSLVILVDLWKYLCDLGFHFPESGAQHLFMALIGHLHVFFGEVFSLYMLVFFFHLFYVLITSPYK